MVYEVNVEYKGGFWKIDIEGSRQYEMADYDPKMLQSWLSTYFDGYEVTDIIHKASEQVKSMEKDGVVEKYQEELQEREADKQRRINVQRLREREEEERLLAKYAPAAE